MATTRSLLKRLEDPSEHTSRGIPGDHSAVIESICDHLRIILNSRQGNALTVPDFGTTDFSEIIKGYQSTQTFQEELRKSIEKYEPRLKDVSITFREDDERTFTMHFDIIGTLVSDGDERPTRFRSVIENNGAIKVRR